MPENRFSRSAHRERQAGFGGAGGPQITEPGDPDFTPSASSQGQVPAAAAQKKIFENQRSAQKKLTEAQQFGYDTTGSDFDPLREQAETGFKEDALGVVGTLVGWIDGPRQAINLMIQDLVGGIAEEGFSNPNVGDYWNALWGGVEDPDGFKAYTGLNPVSGSQTLDMFGWDEAEEGHTGEKISRGIVDFGLQVLTDPLTYITFGMSGVAKKTALTAARSMQDDTIKAVLKVAKGVDDVPLTKYQRHLADDYVGITKEFQDDLTRIRLENGGEYTEGVEHALKRAFGSTDVVEMEADKMLEAAVANRVHKDIIMPLAGRDFKNVHHLALDDLPAYARGGMRISVPFVAGRLPASGAFKKGTLQTGLMVPGTRGLGRKIAGDPMRRVVNGLKKHVPGGQGIADTFMKGVTKLDRSAPMMRELRKGPRSGGIEGWQYHLLESAKENMIRNNSKHQISTTLSAQWDRIAEHAKDAGIDLADVGVDILGRLEKSNMDDTILTQLERLMSVGDPGNLMGQADAIFRHTELNRQVTGMVTYMQDTMAEYHTALGALDPQFKVKFIDGYIPHKPTVAGRKVLTALAGSEAFVPAGQGNAAEDMFSQLLNAVGFGGVTESPLGASKHANRVTGRMQSLQLRNDGVMMLDQDALSLMNNQQLVDGVIDPVSGRVDTTALKTQYMTTTQLNETLAPILEREAKKHNIALPKNWDGKIYDENPINTMIDYIDNMSDAINSWQHVDALKNAGLAMKHDVAVDTQKVIQNLFSNAVHLAKDAKTVHFGRPTIGETDNAPLRWLKQLADPDSTETAIAEIAAGEYESVVNSIRKNGMDSQQPVIVGVTPNGKVGLADGHHRILIAEQLGQREIPVKFMPVPEGDMDTFVNTIDIGEHMKPGWHEEAFAAREAAIAETSGSFVDFQKKGGTFGTDRTWDAFEALDQTPWGAADGVVDNNLLHAADATIPGVPNDVYRDLVKHGIVLRNVGDVHELQQLAKEVAGGNPINLVEAAPVPRPDMFTDEAFALAKSRKEGWGTHAGGFLYAERGKPMLHVSINLEEGVFRVNTPPNLNIIEQGKARIAAIEHLDGQFRNGKLKGLLNETGFKQLVGEGLDQETAGLLHEYVRMKMLKLPHKTQEFLAKEPAEMFQSRMLWDTFVDKYNGIIADSAAVRTQNGSLHANLDRMSLMADDVMLRRLTDLDAAARRAGDAGYDAAVKIMTDTMEYTGVATSPGFVQPSRFNLGGPAIEGLQIQTAMAEELSLMARNQAMINTPEGIAAAKLATNTALKWWRGMATLPRPAFHIRNLVGGSWQNMAHGVTSETMASININGIKFRNALKNAKSANVMEEAFAAIPKKDRAMWEAAWDNNVLAGFATTEFSEALSPATKRSIMSFANITDVDNFALTRAGGRVMESVEDFLRMSLFAQYFDESIEGSARHAASMVDSVHFDYSNLTPTETKLKTWIPFYVWTRRNLPLQIRMAAENPKIIQRYGAMMRSMNDNLGGNDDENLEEADFFSAYAAGTNFKVNEGTPFWGRVMIDPDLPLHDLLDLELSPQGIAELTEGLVGPHISTIFSLLEQQELGDVNAPAPLSYVFQSLAAAGLYNKTMDGDVRVPYWQRGLAETIVPFSREIVDPLTGGPTDPNRQARLGIHPDDNPLEASLKSMLAQAAGGFGIKLTTPADARAAAYRTDAENQQLVREQRLRGGLPQAQK